MAEKKSNRSTWILFGAAAILLFIFVKMMQNNDAMRNSPAVTAGRDALVQKIKANEPNAGEVYINETEVLYIGVKDDGTNRRALAEYYCQTYGREGNLFKVKIVKNGTRDLLGESQCK